jgi:hypothetical protein
VHGYVLKQRCHVGTLEEKVFQRQLSKEGLSNVVNQSGKSAQSDMSTEDLADLFTPDYDCLSSTYEGMLRAQVLRFRIPVNFASVRRQHDCCLVLAVCLSSILRRFWALL